MSRHRSRTSWQGLRVLRTRLRLTPILRTSYRRRSKKFSDRGGTKKPESETSEGLRPTIERTKQPLYNSRNRIDQVRFSGDLVEQLRVYDARTSTDATEVPVKFEFRKMTDEEAQQIAGWRYVPPYDFYD